MKYGNSLAVSMIKWCPMFFLCRQGACDGAPSPPFSPPRDPEPAMTRPPRRPSRAPSSTESSAAPAGRPLPRPAAGAGSTARPPRPPAPRGEADGASRRPEPAARGKRPGGRGDGGLWLFGRHAVEAALQNPERKALRLLALAGAAEGLPKGGPTVEPADREAIEAVVPPGAVHQGLALKVAPLSQPTVEEIARIPGPSVVAILDQVSDPHNIGAVLRSAAAFGIRAVVVQDRHSPEETGTLAKSASGTLERVPLVRAINLSQALDTFKEHGFWCAGLDASAETTLAEAALPERCVVVLGSEGAGLRRLVRDHCDLLVKLAMDSGVESLNVSNAAAVTFYELSGRGLRP
ncbi:RNA methyltransferase TrmH, group 3 [Rhodospirillum rubrum ATCC 11170]|uniref:RNA methyltransferase TrmH, group 3 n=4 Tax=Rhodospirillum rubrum TaxID=1085 RepID=Q2RQU5_RHORT|nr:RNA methyltransferase TrmH, group 3 [Rhodospirillum rubrum ATCC 11170]